MIYYKVTCAGLVPSVLGALDAKDMPSPDKRGRRRSAAIPHNQLSRENVGKV